MDEREKGSVFGRHTARDGGDERGDDARTSGRDGGGGFLERFGACARGEDGGGDGGMILANRELRGSAANLARRRAGER